jgi:hypothetical protein
MVMNLAFYTAQLRLRLTCYVVASLHYLRYLLLCTGTTDADVRDLNSSVILSETTQAGALGKSQHEIGTYAL